MYHLRKSIASTTVTPKFGVVQPSPISIGQARVRVHTHVHTGVGARKLLNLPTVIKPGHYAILESVAAIAAASTHQTDFPDNHGERSSECRCRDGRRKHELRI